MADIKVYTLKETADILKLSERTIYNYVHSGELKAAKIGKYWRVSEDSLRDFINRGTPKANKS